MHFDKHYLEESESNMCYKNGIGQLRLVIDWVEMSG